MAKIHYYEVPDYIVNGKSALNFIMKGPIVILPEGLAIAEHTQENQNMVEYVQKQIIG
jgi:hypothetical protein